MYKAFIESTNDDLTLTCESLVDLKETLRLYTFALICQENNAHENDSECILNVNINMTLDEMFALIDNSWCAYCITVTDAHDNIISKYDACCSM